MEDTMTSFSNPWKTVSLVLSVLLLCTLAFRPAISASLEQRLLRVNSVEAQNFVLRDDHGNIRGELKIEDGKPVFELYNESGKVVWSTEPSLREVH